MVYLGCARFAPPNCAAVAYICCAVSLGSSRHLHGCARDLRNVWEILRQSPPPPASLQPKSNADADHAGQRAEKDRSQTVDSDLSEWRWPSRVTFWPAACRISFGLLLSCSSKRLSAAASRILASITFGCLSPNVASCSDNVACAEERCWDNVCSLVTPQNSATNAFVIRAASPESRQYIRTAIKYARGSVCDR